MLFLEKTYADASDEIFRKKIFAEHLEKIEAHNRLYSEGLKSFTMGINRFSDLVQHHITFRKDYCEGNSLPISMVVAVGPILFTILSLGPTLVTILSLGPILVTILSLGPILVRPYNSIAWPYTGYNSIAWPYTGYNSIASSQCCCRCCRL